MNFDFISDDNFRKILERDYKELHKCIDSESDKSVLILSGSIIESILTEFFSSYPIDGTDPKKILEYDLFKLLELAYENKLISKSTKELSTVIKNYRNLIHPGREIRKKETFDHDTALVAKSVLNIILKEVRFNYVKRVGYSSSDIIKKLENDAVSVSIFEKIIENLNKREKNKLFIELIDYESDLPFDIIENPKKYITIIKKHIDRSIINNKIDDLIKNIHIGKKAETEKLFNILHNEIGHIEKKSRELILLYMISAIKESIPNQEEVRLNYENNIFSTFGEYINDSSEVNEEVVKILIALVQNYKNNDVLYFNAYDQIRYKLTEKEYEDIEDLVRGGTYDFYFKPFYKDYDNGNYLPF